MYSCLKLNKSCGEEIIG